jgi:hypothetical protein
MEEQPGLNPVALLDVAAQSRGDYSGAQVAALVTVVDVNLPQDVPEEFDDLIQEFEVSNAGRRRYALAHTELFAEIRTAGVAQGGEGEQGVPHTHLEVIR